MQLTPSQLPDIANWQVYAVPARVGSYDNYVWVLRQAGDLLIVDPGEAEPVLNFIASLDCAPVSVRILITHHHFDHVAAIKEVAETAAGGDVMVFGPADSDIRGLTHTLIDSDHLKLPGWPDFKVLGIPGHTLDHLAYYNASHGFVFCGDTLFSAGCGRMFEGTPSQFLQTLDRLAGLPPETKVFCGHEYTLANLHFARVVEPENKDLQDYFKSIELSRAGGQPSLPSTIAIERKVNPFLRVREASVMQAAQDYALDNGLERPKSSADVFAVLRTWKDNF